METTEQEEHFLKSGIREWVSQDHLFKTIPKKAQHGLRTFPVEFTCVDVCSTYVAVGSNAGTVFLCSRLGNEIQRLRAHKTKDTVASVSIHKSAIDVMVAFGTNSGAVLIYQLPSEVPGPGHRKQIEKFVIDSAHSHPVTCLEWSLNGMRLFSGDMEGLVLHTQLDFTQHECRSSELIRESHGIVQLNYSCKMLIMSTKRRSAIYHLDTGQLVQVGKQERKVFGDFGGSFIPGIRVPGKLSAYVIRPGLRLWKADTAGCVQETLILKDALQKRHPVIPLLGIVPSSSLNIVKEQFSRVKFYAEKYIVMYSQRTVFVIDLKRNVIIGTCRDLRGIIDVATNCDEIFVLLPNRNVIRLSERAAKETEGQVLFGNGSTLLEPVNHENKTILSSLIRSNASSPLSSILGSFITSNSADRSRHLSSNSSISSLHLDIKVEESIEEKVDVPPVVTLDAEELTPLETSRTNSVIEDCEVEEAQPAEECDFTEEADTSAVTDSLTSTTQDENKSFEDSVEPAVAEPNVVEKLYAIGQQSFDDDIVYASKQKLKKKHRVSPSNSCNAMLMHDGASNPTENSPDQSDPTYTFFSQDSVPIENDKTPEDEPNHVTIETAIGGIMLEKDSSDSEDSDMGDNMKIDTAIGGITLERGTVDEKTADSDSLESDDQHVDESDIYGNKSNIDSVESGSALCAASDARLPSVGQGHSSPYARKDSSSSDASGSRRCSFDGSKVKLADSWTQVTTPGQIFCLAECTRYICCIDLKEHIYYSELSSGQGLKWKLVKSRPAQQIAVSPSGHIVWCLYNTTVYAALKVGKMSPLAQRWTEAVREVAYIAVDESSAWYVKIDGSVWIQRNLNHSRPCYRSEQVECPKRLSQISCNRGAIWVITTEGELYYRVGVTSDKPQGASWVKDEAGIADGITAASISVGERSVWVADTHGRVWFRPGVTATCPRGDGKWWQVVIGGYLVNDSGRIASLDSLRSLASSFHPDRITGYWQQSQLANLIVTARESGVCVAERNKKTMHICRGGILGHRWEGIVAPEMAPSTKWLSVHATGVHGNEETDLMWAQHPSGELFCFRPDGQQFSSIPAPLTNTFSCISAGRGALWALTGNGSVYVRTGVSEMTPQGRDWERLDMSQLEIDGVSLCWLSCGGENVWACDTSGRTYMRVGLNADVSRGFPAAWVPVDNYSYTKLCRVIASPTDNMIWGIDVRHNVYVRKGVSADNPIGTSWVPVPGTHAEQLCISASTVWALTDESTVVRRVGLSTNNYMGDYWKKLPGNFNFISVTCMGQLWAVGADDLLYRHSSYYLTSTDAALLDTSKEDEWEVL